MINTCNELNAGYAADGCARVKGEALGASSCGILLCGLSLCCLACPGKSSMLQAPHVTCTHRAQPPLLLTLHELIFVQAGLGCVCVTFTVGGLSMINALAGAVL